VDPKGVLPPWAVNLTGAQQGMNCLRVVNYAENQRRLILKMYDENVETNRSEVLQVFVPKGEFVELPFTVNAEGKTLVVDWILDENDISFVVLDPSNKELLRADKSPSNLQGKPFYGRVKLNKPGKYIMKFDNSYSWFTGKQVNYHFLVI